MAADGKEKLTRAHYVHVCTTFEWVCNLHCLEVGHVAAITLFTLELQREAAHFHALSIYPTTLQHYYAVAVSSAIHLLRRSIDLLVETKALRCSNKRAHLLVFHTAFFF